MLSTLIQSGAVYPTELCIDVMPKFPYAPSMGGVQYVHGAGSDATYALSPTGNQAARTLKISSRYPGIIGDIGGPASWGNDTSITRTGGYLARLAARAGSSADYALVGSSMGGIISLNYAAQAVRKPKCLAFIIPVINIEDIRANNRSGYAADINAAYGGAYNEATSGATHNPYTYRASNALMGIPMLMFYGLTDALCLPQYTEAFAAADPTNRTLVPLQSGHDFNSYNAVDNERMLSFITQYLP